ncbi:MAG: hypothetical protein RLZZ450_4245 [Pseudomonadota bacterium]
MTSDQAPPKPPTPEKSRDGVAPPRIPGDPSPGLRDSAEEGHATSWITIGRACSDDPKVAREAMGELVRRHWFPIFVRLRSEPGCRTIAQRRGVEPAEIATDATQRLFLSILQRGSLRTLRKDGKFRAWLKRCAYNELLRDWRDESIKHGHVRIEQEPWLDAALAEGRFQQQYAATDLSPAAAGELALALQIWESAHRELAAEQANSPRFASLQHFLYEPIPQSVGTYEQLAKQFAVAPNTIATSVKRLRGRFRQIVEAAVAATLDPDVEGFEGELRAELSAICELLMNTPHRDLAELVAPIRDGGDHDQPAS